MSPQKIFEETKIGNMELKNRIVMAAMDLNIEEMERIKKFYVERARGGAGLIIVGGFYPEPLGRVTSKQLGLASDEVIPELKELTQTLKHYGCKAGCQILHAGRYAKSRIIGTQPIAPSKIPSKLTNETPREMSTEQIREVVEAYADAALRGKKAGFDAVEILAGTGYLISEFLSESTNKRSDRYGGPLKNRMTLLLEIVEATRKEVGPEYPIICRVSAEEYVPGGLGIAETKVLCQALEEVRVDAIGVIAGWHESPKPVVTREVPVGGFSNLARELRDMVSIPVIAGVRVMNSLVAENIISQGRADLVYMARALLADPQLPRKAREDRVEDIRPCITCSHCLSNILGDREIECTVNPLAGHESRVELSPTPKRVLVVGGGPAGLEAALTSARKGHIVELCEKEGELGGAFRLAAKPPYKDELLDLVRYYHTQLLKMGVEIKLNLNVTPRLVKEMGPEAIIVATGSLPPVPDFPVKEAANVMSAWDVLSSDLAVGEKIVVVGGGAIGVETADFLVARGKRVTILEAKDRIALDLDRTIRWIVLRRLHQGKAVILTNTRPKRVIDGRVIVEAEEGEKEIFADMMVLASSPRPNNKLRGKLEDLVGEVYYVGDCVVPRTALEAIREGFEAAGKI